MKLSVVFAVILSLVTGGHAAHETFMVNGIDVNDAVPFYVYLEIFRYPDNVGDIHFGGGTLITEYTILTVAQNVFGFQSWRAGLGNRKIKDLSWFPIETHVIHQNYNASDLANNIAILNLANPISTYLKNVNPTLLAPGGSHIPSNEQVGNIVGFGFGRAEKQPDHLQYAQMTVLTQTECGIAYPHLIRNGQLENHFCASNFTTGTNICGGDQGGPIYSPQLRLVFGIQSFNRIDDCTSPESGPAAFIMVSRYGTWINHYLKTL